MSAKPARRPERPLFSSGPTVKRPGWSPDALDKALLGRSHRSAAGRDRLAEVIERTRRLAGIPDDYRVGIVPGSDTGAVDMALWSLLGPRGVDVLAWDSFGRGWVTDITAELRLADVRRFEADYGELPDLAEVDFERDVVFTWNGTTSGVIVPDGDWIPAERGGLAICDATSAALAVPLPFDRLDVATWSWQKVLGGEAGHGMLVLGPRAVERLLSHRPAWPVPKLFRLTRGGALLDGVFRGDTINTPSMLCVEDALDALAWAEKVGGAAGLEARTRANFAVIERWVAATAWVDFLATDPRTRSPTSVCMRIVDPEFTARPPDARKRLVAELAGLLEREQVAYDVSSYRAAPPGLRVWCGATVEAADLEALTPWLDWAYEQVRNG